MNYFEIGHEFGVINRRTQAYVTLACKPWHISYSEHVMLLTLYSHDGCTQIELGKLLTADKALVARNVKLLEEKKLIYRRQDCEDLRFKYIHLTQKAWDMQREMENIVKRWVTYLLQGVDKKKLEDALETMSSVAKYSSEVHIEELVLQGKEIPHDTQ
ncbi:MarR family transcriptional regulator [Veillonellaceae bacterium M2-8]|nr:MarR family transcriptional regulator [Veillonellaceae bacterium M2-8]